MTSQPIVVGKSILQERLKPCFFVLNKKANLLSSAFTLYSIGWTDYH